MLSSLHPLHYSTALQRDPAARKSFATSGGLDSLSNLLRCDVAAVRVVAVAALIAVFADLDAKDMTPSEAASAVRRCRLTPASG